MNKIKLLLTTIVVSASLCFPALAGTWTHTEERNGNQEPHTYESFWYYIKDDGTYAKSEWIMDSDGIWYWIGSDGMLPPYHGISDEGYLYDDDGRYIDMSDGTRKFLTPDMCRQYKKNMTYEQVVSIFGKEHSIISNDAYSIGDFTTYVMEMVWYSADSDSTLRIEFRDGVTSHMSLYWY